MAASHTNSNYPQPRHSPIRFQNDGWMNSAWSNFELNPNYMQEVGTYALLSAEEELTCAKQYSEARTQIHTLLSKYPQVILGELQILKNAPSGRILDFIEITPRNDDQVYSDSALEKLVREILDDLLAKTDELLQRFAELRPRKTAKSSAQAPTTNEWLSTIFTPFVENFGEITFLPRFFAACVELFVSENWNAPNLGSTQKKNLSRQMAEANEKSIQALNRLVEGNLRLVISIARHFVCTLMPLSDLVQEGNIGLMRAVETFEYQRGHRFSTYASYWIRQAITHALNTNGRAIRIPVNIVRQLSKIHRVEREHLQAYGRPPSMEELAALVDLSVPRVRALLKMGQQPLSLQSIATEDRDWNDILADEENFPQQRENGLDAARTVLDLLEPREREILIRRFGLLGHSVETLEQVAKRFGLTGERIRQIETIALRKLRTPKSYQLLDNIDS